MASLALFGTMGSVSAQTDVTSQYIVDPGFEAVTVLTQNVVTYAKDAAANNTTLSSLQPVANWKVSGTGDAMAGGVYAYGSTNFLGGTGYLAPASDNLGHAGNALGIVNVWGAEGYYSLDVANLQPGDYTLTVNVYNSVGGTNAVANEIGFVESNGTTHYGKTTQYAVGKWTVETINFSVATASSGTIRLGYKSLGAGSAANPHLFFDNLTLTYKEAVIKSELKSTIDNITKKNEVLNNSDLASAIATAQGVYDNASATQSEVNTATANLNAAFETAKKSMSDNLNVTTLFVQNNSFETGNGNGWTFNIASDTGVKPNSNGTYTTSGIDGSYLFNTWDGTTTQKYVKQTLTNLPEGYYQLSVLYASDANLTADIINGDTRTKATATGKDTFVPVTTGKVYVADGGSLEIGATSATWY